MLGCKAGWLRNGLTLVPNVMLIWLKPMPCVNVACPCQQNNPNCKAYLCPRIDFSCSVWNRAPTRCKACAARASHRPPSPNCRRAPHSYTRCARKPTVRAGTIPPGQMRWPRWNLNEQKAEFELNLILPLDPGNQLYLQIFFCPLSLFPFVYPYQRIPQRE